MWLGWVRLDREENPEEEGGVEAADEEGGGGRPTQRRKLSPLSLLLSLLLLSLPLWLLFAAAGTHTHTAVRRGVREPHPSIMPFMHHAPLHSLHSLIALTHSLTSLTRQLCVHFFLAVVMDSQALIAGTSWEGSFPPAPFRRACEDWNRRFDPLQAQHPTWFEAMITFELIFMAPFMLIGAWAYATEREWIRTPTLLYATSMFYS